MQQKDVSPNHEPRPVVGSTSESYAKINGTGKSGRQTPRSFTDAVPEGVASHAKRRTVAPTHSPAAVGHLLASHFRCAGELAEFVVAGKLSTNPGYFKVGSDIICHGRCSSGTPANHVTDALHDAAGHIGYTNSSVQLPFDAEKLIESLRYERYLSDSVDDRDTLPANRFVRSIYYLLRPLLPVKVRRHLQKLYFDRRGHVPFPGWPVDRTVENLIERLLVLSMKSQNIDRMPFIWFWPDGAPSCTMMTHDVETAAGVDFCGKLMDINDAFGIKSSFQIVPENRYEVSPPFLDSVRARGFEVNVHDLNHDGHLFRDRTEFLQRAAQINDYGRQFKAQGFRSAVLYRNVPWHEELDFSYDMSIPNVAHYDPQKGGCCTVFPFFAGKILELPVTATQDYTLFNIFEDYSLKLWKQQISRIRESHGLMSFIVHPDYVIEDKARAVYVSLLEHLAELRSQGETWIALPGEVASWWRTRHKLTLVGHENDWRVEGEGRERARVAYATLDGDRLVYTVAQSDRRSTVELAESALEV